MRSVAAMRSALSVAVRGSTGRGLVGCPSSGASAVFSSGAASTKPQTRALRNAVAAVFHGPGQPHELRDMALPDRLREGELLVRLDCATICGSDLHTVDGKRREPTPLVLGHEGVGVIEAIGTDIFSGERPRKGAWKLHEGDRVTFSVADSCGVCPECSLHKLPQKCVSLMKYGHAPVTDGLGLNGTYATHILLRRGTHVVPLPSGLSSRVASPANCALATVVNSLDMARLPRFGSNNSAVVQGAGLLGIYAVAWLKKRVGMEHVFCLDTNASRLKTAERFGAIPLLVEGSNAEEAEAHAAERAKQIRAWCPRGVDVVVEMSGQRNVLNEGVSLLRHGGHYAFCGMVHPDSRLSTLTGETIVRKCLTIRGVHNYTPWNLTEAVQFMEEHKDTLPWESVLSPTSFNLSRIDDAFEEAFTGEHCRVVVKCDL